MQHTNWVIQPIYKIIYQKTVERTVLSKALKQALIDKYGSKCFIYLETMDKEVLQVDHRIPYEIGGEHDEKDIDYYMLFCPSAHRAKSWTCEHCGDWKKKDKILSNSHCKFILKMLYLNVKNDLRTETKFSIQKSFCGF